MTYAERLSKELRSIADEMRSTGASTMTPHELLAYYAREVNKVADSLMFAATLESEELERENSKLEHKMSNMETKLLKAQERIDELLTAATLGSKREMTLEELVQDWQVLYEDPDYGDCIRLRKRMQDLGIEVIRKIEASDD